MKEENISQENESTIEYMENELSPEELEDIQDLLDTSDIEAELMGSDWKEEAEQIPLEALERAEQLVVLKCINEEELTKEETETLQRVLAQYRPAIQKIKPQEQLQNYQDNILLIEDEKTFLELEDDFNKIQVIPFTFYIGDKQVRMKFDLYPITDSTKITDITENLSMFQDFTEDELVTYNKMQNDEQLTREEILIRARVQQKINKATIENTKQTVVEYLAMQLKFHGKDTSNEAMKKVLGHVPNAYLNALFDEVQRRNHLNDINTDAVFQTFD